MAATARPAGSATDFGQRANSALLVRGNGRRQANAPASSNISMINRGFSSTFKARLSRVMELTKPVSSTIVRPNRHAAMPRSCLDDYRYYDRLCKTTGPDRGGYRSAAGEAFIRFTSARRDRAAEAADGCDALFEPRRGKTAAAVPGGREFGRVRRSPRIGAAGGRRARM